LSTHRGFFCDGAYADSKQQDTKTVTSGRAEAMDGT
jgi:hypothetical protein